MSNLFLDRYKFRINLVRNHPDLLIGFKMVIYSVFYFSTLRLC